MAIKNGALYIPSFDPTANPGEYSITGATINSLTCPNGVMDLQIGWVLWATAIEVNTGSPIPGTAHRYRIESVVPTDTYVCNLIVKWDEPGVEQDSPQSGSWVAFSEVTPNLLYGLPPSDLVYTDLPLGMTTAAMLSNTNISDKQTGGDKNFVFTQSTPSAVWTIDHPLNKQPSVFIEDADGNDVDAGVDYPVGMETSRVVITFLGPIAGKATLN